MQGPYDAGRVEAHWYEVWESRGYFQPADDDDRKPFVIVIPPPNITGSLHNGHVMFVTYQDLMIRWQRMRGRAALWVPGTDHAAIATENVIERELRNKGTSRLEVGRERFIDRFWDWKEQYGSTINDQLRRLGASVDWTREHFTMDEQLSRAVSEAFVRLYERGLIYRGEYLVNWCPADRSAISDLEVEHEEVAGHLWHIRYPLAAGGHVVVATTRPETMLGDTAIAVHPDDDRHRELVGGTAIVPGIGREIPIVADDLVDPEFGSGVVKVTPGHDPNDWKLGARHELPVINIMNPDGTLNENAGRWAGEDRLVAREHYLAFLAGEGLIERVEDHIHSVGHCYRDGAIVEPLVSEQWFVNVRPLADRAVEAVRDGRLTFHPARFAREFLRWMEIIQPWCISRQLWLGHRIPVWYCRGCSETVVARDEPTKCPACGSHELEQDSDVLDTWFSSGLWPFSTLGWPDETDDMRRFYPTDVLETGYDILFFWIARMVMLGLELTGELPFHSVYLHGLVRHLDGTKVSKSNYQPGDNPLDTIEKYGADALRLMFVTSSTPGNDVRLNLQRVEGAAHFANKLWNGAKFVIGAMERAPNGDPAPAGVLDRWITGRFNQVHAEVIRLVDGFQFGEAGRTLQDFLWGEFFDWYVEAAKIRLNGDDEAQAARVAQTLGDVLDGSIRLLHPFMPFITEEIWRHYRAGGGAVNEPEHLIVTPLPDPAPEVDAASIETVRGLIEIVQGIRNARHESKVEPGRMIEARIRGTGDLSHLEAERDFIERLARVDPLHIGADGEALDEPAVSVRAGGVEIELPLAGMVDLNTERDRLSGELSDARGELARAEALLQNPNFVDRAPPHVVQKERDKLTNAATAIDQIEERLAGLEG